MYYQIHVLKCNVLVEAKYLHSFHDVTCITLLHVDADSVTQSVNSSRNSPFVTLIWLEGGG